MNQINKVVDKSGRKNEEIASEHDYFFVSACTWAENSQNCMKKFTFLLMQTSKIMKFSKKKKKKKKWSKKTDENKSVCKEGKNKNVNCCSFSCSVSEEIRELLRSFFFPSYFCRFLFCQIYRFWSMILS